MGSRWAAVSLRSIIENDGWAKVRISSRPVYNRDSLDARTANVCSSETDLPQTRSVYWWR